jgi:capsular exopolysaccharide synthesis family protein
MGRVDQALRRAMGSRGPEASGEPAATEGFPPEDAASAAVIAPEAFPSEEGAAGLTLSAGPAADTPALAVASAPAGPAGPNGEGGTIRISSQLDSKVVVDVQMEPASREEYRRLAAALHHAQEASGIKLVMVASAVAGEGKSLTAANLALTLSESYRRRVLLVDGDLRRPTQHSFFGLDVSTGLTDALDAIDEPELTVHEVSPTLAILPAGRPTSDPMAGLTSARMRRILEEARGVFDWVLVDTPPVGLMSDARLLAAMTDAAVLVIKANSTPLSEVLHAADALGRDRILGTVLNRVTADERRIAYDYYRYYQGAGARSGG